MIRCNLTLDMYQALRENETGLGHIYNYIYANLTPDIDEILQIIFNMELNYAQRKFSNSYIFRERVLEHFYDFVENDFIDFLCIDSGHIELGYDYPMMDVSDINCLVVALYDLTLFGGALYWNFEQCCHNIRELSVVVLGGECDELIVEDYDKGHYNVHERYGNSYMYMNTERMMLLCDFIERLYSSFNREIRSCNTIINSTIVNFHSIDNECAALESYLR